MIALPPLPSDGDSSPFRKDGCYFWTFRLPLQMSANLHLRNTSTPPPAHTKHSGQLRRELCLLTAALCSQTLPLAALPLHGGSASLGQPPRTPSPSPEAGHEIPSSAQQPAQRLLDAVCWRGRLGWLLEGCLAALRAPAQLLRWCLLPVQRNPHQLPGRLRRASEANPFNKQIICTFFYVIVQGPTANPLGQSH